MLRYLFSRIALSTGISLMGPALAQDAPSPDQNESIRSVLENITVTGTRINDPELKDCDAFLIGVDKAGKTKKTCVKMTSEQKLEQQILFSAIFSESYDCAKVAGKIQVLDQILGQKTTPEIQNMITTLQNHAVQNIVGEVRGKAPDDAVFVEDYAKKLLEGDMTGFKQLLPLDSAAKDMLKSFRATAYTAVNYCSEIILGYNFHSSFNDPKGVPKVEITGTKPQGKPAELQGTKQEP